MLILQIILVPVLALTILGAVFVIGVNATLSPKHDSQDDQALYQDGQ